MTQAQGQPQKVPKTLGQRLKRRLRRIRRLRHALNRFVARYSLIGDPPVFDPAVFPWTGELERNWRAILDEATALVGRGPEVPALGDISPDHQRLDHRRSWRTLFLWGYGYRVDENCLLAPRTAELVDRIPGIVSALFSIHEPGTHLPRHRGVTKGIITCHLGLIIPEDREHCCITVADRPYHWTPGHFFIFDDTCYHEVWNRTDEHRVILLIHVRRPLRGPGLWFESFFFRLIQLSPFVQRVRRRLGVR